MQNGTVQVLLADDDEDDRLLFRDAFNEIKIKTNVNTVNDGVELMKILNQKNSLLPHILFLDLNMPRKTGMECLLEIKNTGNLKDIPIAIYSTSASEEDIEESIGTCYCHQLAISNLGINKGEFSAEHLISIFL